MKIKLLLVKRIVNPWYRLSAYYLKKMFKVAKFNVKKRISFEADKKHNSFILLPEKLKLQHSEFLFEEVLNLLLLFFGYK